MIPMIPLDAEPNEAQKHEAIAIVLAGLGEAEIRIAASYTTPFFWTLRNSNGDEMLKGGSAFFIDTGERVFAVTASHVVEECLQDTKSRAFIQCMLGSGGRGTPVPFHLGDRLIDAHRGIDIATFWMKPEEVRQTAREVLQGYYYPGWPPPEKVTGATADRPQLKKLLATVGYGDVVVIAAVDRLSRDTTDLMVIARDLQKAGAGLRSLAEPVVDTTSDFAELVLAMLGVAAKLERRRIKERTARGRADAKANGVKFGRKPKLTPHQKREAIKRRDKDEETLRSIGRSYNVSAATISRLS
jgi:DNA invertase Pin-like site-specific DNA recombinase